MVEQKKIRVGITSGDINGVGYEVILKALSEKEMLEFCTPVIYGSAKAASYYKEILDCKHVYINSVNSASSIDETKINLVNVNDSSIKVEFGQMTEQGGKASFESLESATADLKSGLIDVVVTAPISKENIQKSGFKYNGHTEYFADKFGGGSHMMLMASDNLKIGFVTSHISLKDVATHITKETIVEKLKIMSDTLLRDFSRRKGRIAVLSLNPHAGENGILGNEEQEIIIPAIKEATKIGINAYGPYPADGFFGSVEFRKFDAVLAMYHDQGLPVFKLLNFDSGVNYTAGLDIIRTSPVHGTAFDIAGKNEADESSFRNALYMAIDTYKSRISYDKISANPVKSHNFQHKSRRDPNIDELREVKQIENNQENV
ncbi:MAG: 4-hydroxythreonine-4-phosphate dehydrogenase PdxA [Bacteroidales bacterium]